MRPPSSWSKITKPERRSTRPWTTSSPGEEGYSPISLVTGDFSTMKKCPRLQPPVHQLSRFPSQKRCIPHRSSVAPTPCQLGTDRRHPHPLLPRYLAASPRCRHPRPLPRWKHLIRLRPSTTSPSPKNTTWSQDRNRHGVNTNKYSRRKRPKDHYDNQNRLFPPKSTKELPAAGCSDTVTTTWELYNLKPLTYDSLPAASQRAASHRLQQQRLLRH
jgi:hypothetical protein